MKPRSLSGVITLAVAGFLACGHLGKLGAASPTVTNVVSGDDIVLVLGLDGDPIPVGEGSIQIGRLTVDEDLLPTDRYTLADCFEPFGNTLSFGFNGLPGLFQSTVLDWVDDTAFNGEK